jgi:hypothetical protein
MTNVFTEESADLLNQYGEGYIYDMERSTVDYNKQNIISMMEGKENGHFMVPEASSRTNR